MKESALSIALTLIGVALLGLSFANSASQNRFIKNRILDSVVDVLAALCFATSLLIIIAS